MTIPQFLKKLRATRRPWLLNKNGAIRCADGRCPIVAVAGVRFTRVEWYRVHERLKLSSRLGARIANAADDIEGSYPKLRAQLLAATVGRQR